MFDLSDAFVALPGGFGTLDEMFEMLTWRQLGLGSKPCAFLDVDDFYDPLLAMIDRMVAERFLHPDQRADLWHGDDIDGLFAWLRDYKPAQASKWLDAKHRRELRCRAPSQRECRRTPVWRVHRSDERRGGKECVSTCRYRCAPYH